MAKATHQGTCQVCHSTQKLPSGRLSLHGYTVDYGFFNGTCFGAKHPPLEESCELVKADIARCDVAIISLENRRETLLQPATEPKAWVQVYYSSRHGYMWTEVDVKPGEVYQYVYEIIDRGRKEEHQLPAYTPAAMRDILAACTYHNQQYVTNYIDRQIASLKAHVERQKEVVKNWKPAALKPLRK